MGFTNDVTVAVWLGYDNAGGKRRTLGSGSTGGAVAVPVFEPIIQAAWSNNAAPKRALAPPSSQAKLQLSCTAASDAGPREGHKRRGGASAITECFRVDRTGRIADTKYRLVSREAGAQREEAAPRGRPAYAYDTQGRWSDVPLQGMSQWRSRGPYEWRAHRPIYPGFRWRRQ
jgi:membrane carboxypeptidase/penicillin-binding protein